MIPELGFSLQPQYNLPTAQIVALLREAGFSAVSPVWSPELDLNLLASCLRTHGMRFQSLHAPHRGVPLLWEPDAPEAAEFQQRILCCIDSCTQHQIPIMVLHGWQGLQYEFPCTPLDFRFLDRMVDYAEQRGISIAFENLEGEEYLSAMMTRYCGSPHIGFCWDSGHDHCYPHKTDFLLAYGHRLIMTHLNDNLGVRDPAGIPSTKDDLHLLPFDGNIDWSHALHRLESAPIQTVLNFEVKLTRNASNYATPNCEPLSLEAFIAEAGKRAHRIAEQYRQIIHTQQTHPVRR